MGYDYILQVSQRLMTWGFSVLRPFLLQWAVTLPLELTAAGFTIQYWDSQKTVPIAVWITIFAAIISEWDPKTGPLSPNCSLQ